MNPVDVVISGIGGRFPRSNNIKEFSENLLSGKSLLEPIKRWPPGMMGTPILFGQTLDSDRFDHLSFMMHHKIALDSDVMVRKATETSFEALVDAGVCPTSILGTNAQVYTATFQSEEDCFLYASGERNMSGFVITGKNRSMSANRISYVFNLTGRSCSYDASGGWIGTGLKLARQAIQSGECDTVFVNGSASISVAEVTKNRQNMGVLSDDSSCRPFDFDTSGMARGEAQITFLVQRADIAKRSYGSIVSADVETQATLPNWFLSLNQDHLRDFVSSLYRRNGVDPNNIKILEADGLGLKEIVEAELNALDEIMNANRPQNSPLYLGSVKTVMGDADGAAGCAALTKLILAMETGIISPTLNFGKANPNIRGLSEGRFKVITEPTQWEVTSDTLVAVSSVTMTGLVSHVVLKANGKTKKRNVKNECHLPYLVLMSGRTEDFVMKSLKEVTSSTFDPEYLRLTQEVFSITIDKFEWRGFGFHGQDESEKFLIQRENRRPVWFVYSGMGSQWPGMGKELMLFPNVRETFQRLHNILKSKGINLMEILTSLDAQIFDNILHSFVGIAAVQIALTNLLRQLGIVPDGLIGHSVGELGCSYADDCLTEEQIILCAYERGMASLKADLIPGLMAAVGLGYKQAKDLMPPDVYIACHNSQESCTISGPTESVNEVISSLEEQRIFVRGVNVSNIAYHSPYIQPAAPYLLESLRKLIPCPKLRSSKWVCTSASEAKWDNDEVRYCSAEYHTNNLLGSVLFEEGSVHIPPNALVIEIAPHGLLQAILKRSLSNDAVNVSLTRRGVRSPATFLLRALGKLFLEGLSPKIWHLYPDVEMPVSRSTPALAPLVKWQHHEVFESVKDPTKENFMQRSYPMIGIPFYSVYIFAGISYLTDQNENRGKDLEDFISLKLNDSCPSVEIAEKTCLLPAHALMMTYYSFSKLNEFKSDGKVIFEDVRFSNLMRFDDQEDVQLMVHVLPTSGLFHIMRNEALVVRGKIRVVDYKDGDPTPLPEVGAIEYCLNSNDIYTEMKTRGVVFPDKFKTIQDVHVHGFHDWTAGVPFDGDWTILLNSLITLLELGACGRDQKPASISRIKQLIFDRSQENKDGTRARLHLPTGTVVYPGIRMFGVEFTTVSIGVELAALRFVPFGLTSLEDEKQFLSHVVQLSSEKRWHQSRMCKVFDVDGEHSSITKAFQEFLKSKCEVTNTPKVADLLICGQSSIPALATVLADSNNLLITRCGCEDRAELNETLRNLGLHIIAESNPAEPTNSLLAITFLLPPVQPSDCEIIKMGSHDRLPTTLNNSARSLTILVWETGIDQPLEKILNQLQLTGCVGKIRLVIVMTPNSPSFSMSLPLYADQLRLNVPLNIYLDGKWGSYRLFQVPAPCYPGDNRYSDLAIREDILTDRDNRIKLKFADVTTYSENNWIDLTSSKEVIVYSQRNSNSLPIVGIATCADESRIFVPDPKLFWIVPEEWNLDDAASVLPSYAMAYFILLEVGQLQTKESIFITCPLTPVGQAAIQIAASLDCDIVTLVSSSQEREQLQALFPKLTEIIVCSSDVFMLTFKLKVPHGVDLIVSDLAGSRLKLSALESKVCGRAVQFGEETMLATPLVGMELFLRVQSFFGVTHHALLNVSEEVKDKVAKWVQNGLETGVVQPRSKITKSLPSQITNDLKNGQSVRAPNQGGLYEEINSHCVKEDDYTDAQSKLKNTRSNFSVIVGGSEGQWIHLAYSLAKKRPKLVAIVQVNLSPIVFKRHSKILQREFGTELRHLTAVRSGADLFNRELGTIEAVFVCGINNFAEEVACELDARGLKHIRLTFFSKTSTHFSRICERWSQKGLKIKCALGIDDLATSPATHLLDWIWSSAAPTVSVVNHKTFVDINMETISLMEARILPSSASQLQSLGSAIRKLTSPVFREIVTFGRSLRHRLEVTPLFFIKGIHGTATSELRTLSSSLLTAVIEVSLNENCGSLETTALTVFEGIQRIQSMGPYNLAGDSIRTDVIMKVARMLEDKGFASVVFLMNENIDSLRAGVQLLEKNNRLGESILKSCLEENLGPQAWSDVIWENLTWDTQVETAISRIPSLDKAHREDLSAALHHIYTSVKHFLQAREKITLNHGIVHSLRKGEEDREFRLTDRLFHHLIPSSKLMRKEIADIILPNLATPSLQLQLNKIYWKKM